MSFCQGYCCTLTASFMSIETSYLAVSTKNSIDCRQRFLNMKDLSDNFVRNLIGNNRQTLWQTNNFCEDWSTIWRLLNICDLLSAFHKIQNGEYNMLKMYVILNQSKNTSWKLGLQFKNRMPTGCANTLYNCNEQKSISERSTQQTLMWMGCNSRRQHQVPLLSTKNKNDSTHRLKAKS